MNRNNIGMIVNLQREGEHPYCGPDKELDLISGFSYDPQKFVTEDIKFRPSGWKDMSVPESMNFMLEIVKDMAVVIKEKKKNVLVHCHAGYGRTGVVIACYMIFDSNRSTEEVIEILRQKRPGCVQKQSQYTFCNKFKDYIDRARLIFIPMKLNLEYFMKNQTDVLFGEDHKKYQYIPKLISMVLERIIELKTSHKISKADIYSAMYFPPNWTSIQEDHLLILKKRINENNYDSFNDFDDLAVLVQLLYDWLEDCVKYIINPGKIDKILDQRGLSPFIRKQISGFKNLSKEEKTNLSEKIKVELKTIEFETLVFITHFLNEIKPDPEDESEEYDKMVERLYVQLLGFSFQSVYENDNIDEVHGIFYYSNGLKKIMDYFCLIMENDVTREDNSFLKLTNSDFSPYMRSRINNIGNSNEVSFSKFAANINLVNFNSKNMIHFNNLRDVKINNFNSIPSMPQIIKKSPQKKVSNNINHVIIDNEESIISNNSYANDREKFFYELYRVLEYHFSRQTSIDDSQKEEKLQEFNTFINCSGIKIEEFGEFKNYFDKFVTRSYSSNFALNNNNLDNFILQHQNQHQNQRENLKTISENFEETRSNNQSDAYKIGNLKSERSILKRGGDSNQIPSQSNGNIKPRHISFKALGNLVETKDITPNNANHKYDGKDSLEEVYFDPLFISSNSCLDSDLEVSNSQGHLILKSEDENIPKLNSFKQDVMNTKNKLTTSPKATNKKVKTSKEFLQGLFNLSGQKPNFSLRDNPKEKEERPSMNSANARREEKFKTTNNTKYDMNKYKSMALTVLSNTISKKSSKDNLNVWEELKKKKSDEFLRKSGERVRTKPILKYGRNNILSISKSAGSNTS
jgi:hypothetical protein